MTTVGLSPGRDVDQQAPQIRGDAGSVKETPIFIVARTFAKKMLGTEAVSSGFLMSVTRGGDGSSGSRVPHTPGSLEQAYSQRQYHRQGNEHPDFPEYVQSEVPRSRLG